MFFINKHKPSTILSQSSDIGGVKCEVTYKFYTHFDYRIKVSGKMVWRNVVVCEILLGRKKSKGVAVCYPGEKFLGEKGLKRSIKKAFVGLPDVEKNLVASFIRMHSTPGCFTFLNERVKQFVDSLESSQEQLVVPCE